MEKKTVVLNRNKRRLSAILHTPRIKTDKIVIFVHSFKGDKDYQPIMRDCSRKLCSEGYAVIRFDCYGSGESGGKFEDATISSEIRDLRDVIKFVKRKGYSEIALVGLSMGSTVAIKACDKSIKTIILWSPPFDHRPFYKEYKPEMERQGFVIRERRLTGELVKVGKKMWKEFGSINLGSDIRAMKCPVLVVYGAKDEVVRYSIVKKYFRNFHCIKKLSVIKGGDHNFLLKRAEKKVISKTVQWIKKYL